MKIHEQRMINMSDIKPYANNARTHSTQQIEQIVKSIKEFGFTNPLLIDNDCNLIAGHGRLEAIRWLNNFDYKDKPITQLPAVIVSDLSDTQRRALVIADNNIALNAGWDLYILKDELALLENENYDMDLLGFSDSELRDLLNSNIDYDSLSDDFTIPSNDKSDFKQITITLNAEHAEKILKFQKENQGTALANGDNYNANANIIWNIIKDRV